MYNFNCKNFIQRAQIYCAKVIPLVFDNSLSYYEFLCHVCAKLNETIDAVNAQNLNIIEFTKMISLELEKFESYMEKRQTDFENTFKADWEKFKAEISAEWDAYKAELDKKFNDEIAKNEQFRKDITAEMTAFKSEISKEIGDFKNEITTQFNDYKTTVNTMIEKFEADTNADLTAFKATMQTQQNEFEAHMVAIFNQFTADETTARTEFEANFQKLFEQWKIDTLAALDTWKTDTTAQLIALINEKSTQIESSIKAWVQGYVADLSRALATETENREKADANLQNQIDQLTPEGAIKADEPNSAGDSQLYIIDKTTSQRKNIYPVIKNSGGVRADIIDDHATISLTEYLKNVYCNIFYTDGTADEYQLSQYHTIADYVNAGQKHAFGKICFTPLNIPQGATIGLVGWRSAPVTTSTTFTAWTTDSLPTTAPISHNVDDEIATVSATIASGVQNVNMITQTTKPVNNIFTVFDLSYIFNYLDTVDIVLEIHAANAALYDTKTNKFIVPIANANNADSGRLIDYHTETVTISQGEALYKTFYVNIANLSTADKANIVATVNLVANSAGEAMQIANSHYDIAHYVQDGVYFFTAVRVGTVDAHTTLEIRQKLELAK